MNDTELHQLRVLLERSFDLPVAAKRPPGARGKTHGTDLRRALDAIEAEIEDRAAARAKVVHNYEIEERMPGVFTITCSCGESIRAASFAGALGLKFAKERADAHANPVAAKPLESMWE